MKTTALLQTLLTAGFKPSKWDTSESRQIEQTDAAGTIKVCCDFEGEPPHAYATYTVIKRTLSGVEEFNCNFSNGTPEAVVAATIQAIRTACPPA